MPDRIGFRLRSGALAIDVSGVLLLSFLFAPWIGLRLGLGGAGPGTGGLMSGAVAGTTLIGLLWFGVEALWAATPGKLALGLRVGTDDGHEAPLPVTVQRWALKNAPTLVGLVAVVVGAVAPAPGRWLGLLSDLTGLVVLAGCFLALGQGRQALHDRLAGTAVYRAAHLLPLEDAPED